MALSSDQPGKLDFRWYPRNAHTRTLTWEDIDLTDRTFELRRPSADTITVDVVDADTMTFTVPAITKNSLRQAWSLVETTDADEITWMGGTIFWELSYDDEEDDNAVTVTLGNGIPITVVGSGAVALAAEAAARAAGDATNAAAITAEATARATADALKLAKASNLSDVADAATALANLGGQPAGTYLVPADIGSSVDAFGAAAAAQAAAVQRANHTGVQAESTVTNLVADLAARVTGSQVTTNTQTDAPNTKVDGHSSNAIASDISGGIISGGGATGYNNVIGGDGSVTVGTTTPNTTTAGTGAHQSVIMGGYDDVAGGLASVIAAMHSYTAIGSSHGVIVGGSFHRITNPSGTNTTGQYATVVGGTANETSGNYATVIGGTDNVSSGTAAICLGGALNTASGTYSLAQGSQCTASGSASRALGQLCSAEGNYSGAVGRQARARTPGAQVQSGGQSATLGDIQTTVLTLYRTTTDATVTTLGVAGGNTGHMLLDGQSVGISVRVVGRSAAGTVADFKIEGTAEKQASVNSAIKGNPVTTTYYNPSGCTVTLTAGSSVGTISVRVTGVAATTILWSARMELTEVLL